MPTPTYTPLATVTLGSSASSVTFSSIPATYRDLIVVFAGTASELTELRLRLNGDTASNYSFVLMRGNGSITESLSSSPNTAIFAGGRLTTGQSNVLFNIMDYSATDKHKTVLGRDNNTGYGVVAVAGRYASTSAITSVNIGADSGTFSTGATFNLYGIAS
jgi:hypothetical protein